MMPRSVRISWTLAMLAGVLLLIAAAMPRPAAARTCTLTPTCDFLNASCWVCTDDREDSSVSNWEAGDRDHPIRPEFWQSEEAQLAAQIWLDMERSGFPRVPDPHPARSVSEETAARDRAAGLLRAQIFRDRAREGRAEHDDVLGICRPPASSGVPVPRDQGGPRDVAASGEPRSAGAEPTKLDPVDPLTGELIVEHVDLALPSFGVPFSHRRVYRSRVTYDGPLGPGWDFSYNQRLVEAPARELEPVSSGTGRYGVLRASNVSA